MILQHYLPKPSLCPVEYNDTHDAAAVRYCSPHDLGPAPDLPVIALPQDAKERNPYEQRT